MANLRDLATSMRKRAAVVETMGNTLSQAGTQAMLETLVEVTPVDTSAALSNWQVNLNNPPADELPPYFAGSHGSTRASSGQEALTEGTAEIERKKPGQTIFLSNMVPYITRLDEGSSSQFPGGFVPRALLVFRLAMQEAAKNLFK